jgi:hypothetical protein
LPGKIHKENIKEISRLGETSIAHSQRAYVGLNQSFVLSKLGNCPSSRTVVPMVMRMNTITILEFSLFALQRLMNGGETRDAGGQAMI